MLDEALTIFTDVGAEEDVVDVLARKAECDLLIGDSDGALALVDEAWARTLASDAGGSSVPLLLRSRAYALAQMGQLDEARAAIDQSLVAARSRRQDLDVALTLHALKRLAAIDGSAPSAEVVAEADEILERLGVEAVVDVPLSRILT